MDYQYPKNLLIPGYAFKINVEKTNFPRIQQFQLNNNIPSLIDKPKAKGPLISVYLRQKCLDLPAWVCYDKKVLNFDAYYQQPVAYCDPSRQIRLCKIMFYLEDGTMKIFEPNTENSGLLQGTLLSRQRVPFPPPKDEQYYEISDLNVGKEIEIYGKTFKIIDCDMFTRKFLVRLGIFVPDPIEPPIDPLTSERKKERNFRLPKKPKNNKSRGFLERLPFESMILSFKAFWDDRQSEYGYVHKLKVHYYLYDDTMEILEESEKDSPTITFVKRSKVPKYYTGLKGPGHNDPKTILNICRVREDKYNTVDDRLSLGCFEEEFFGPQNLSIGTVINVYGRKVVLHDCDNFTKKYYNEKYGIDDFTPIQLPETEKPVEYVPLHKRKLPPWNGYGSYEDSAQNCITVEPKEIMRDAQKFYALDRDGGDSRILRFQAYLVTDNELVTDRKFIISYYLVDDTIRVLESIPDTCTCNTFLQKQKIPLPGEEIFGSEPPKCYESSDMYIGATLNITGFIFRLMDADEYALRYMELHPNEFPKSNIDTILNKVREKLRPSYRDFIARCVAQKTQTLSYCKLEEELNKVMAEDWTKQEMITLARHYAVLPEKRQLSREYIRQIVQTQIRKSVWNELDRLKEYFHQRDALCTGHLPIQDVYNLLRASRVPLSLELLQHLLCVLCRNDEGGIFYEDLFNFLDESFQRRPDAVMTSVAHNPCNVESSIPRTACLVHWCAFCKDLNLDDTFKDT